VGSDIPNPVALSWWDPDHLLVLNQPGSGPAQLYEVRLDGGLSTPLATPGAPASVTARGSDLVVGTTGSGGEVGPGQYQIWTSPILNGPWRRIAAQCFSPVFPG
jgi:hypothetical protein